MSKTKENFSIKKVFVGMSGGVDSSVSAALLKKHGYDVTGVFIKVWQPDFLPCNWKEDRRDAMRVCAHFDIPFITLDLEKEYKKEVVDYMINEYKKGNTPNPDVMCNKYVKFGGFFDWAMKNNADFVATGHYAQVKDSHSLLKGKDENKDQTYFLWTLTQKQLSKTLFPIGNLEKSEVRKLAKKFKLPNAEKKDSQGLCFVGKVDMKDFLSHFIKEKNGNVIDINGNIIGQHKGIMFWTIGQKIAGNYVVSKNIKNNTLIVSTKVKPLQSEARITIKDVNLINKPIKKSKTYQCQIRYHGEFIPTKVKPLQKGMYELKFIKNGEIPASGQSIVIYDKKECVGGGIVI